MKINVIGTGYVGLVSGVCLAAKGHSVRCFDTNFEKIQILKSFKCPFYEKGLERYLEENLNNNFNVSNKPLSSDVYIITVGTPLSKNKKKTRPNHIKKICPRYL